MANEITVSTTLRWSKGGAALSGTASLSVDQVGDQAIESVQIIGASSEAVSFGDVTTVGYVLFKNLNALLGATIHVGTTSPVTSGNAQMSLAPGHANYLATTQAAWYAISSTGSSNLLVIAVET